MASPPWITYARKLRALFGSDPAVTVEYDGTRDEPTVTLRVEGEAKAEAIRKLLPSVRGFGNATLIVRVIPSNEGSSVAAMMRTAFEGNPVVRSVQEAAKDSIISGRTYVCFAPYVVQFFNDELTSPEGTYSALLEDVAFDVFDGIDGVSFCTAADETPTVWP